jgi:4-amino-4-deoxy-L-arabinose transferase-like glycosyltransferase
VPNLGVAPIERAEIYFLDVARAMVETGDWLVPRYEGERFFDKPPLAYWAMATSFLWLDISIGAARLVAVFAAVGVALATFALGRLLFDSRSALIGGLVLSTTLAFLSFARLAMSDMLLCLFTTLAVALALRLFRDGPPRWTAPAFGVALGLGFLAKGPVALLVPGLAAVLLLVGTRRRGGPLPFGAGSVAVAAVSFAVIAVPWFALIYRRLGWEPLAYFFLRENVERFAGEAYDVGRPVWFYLPTYFAEGLPWSPFLPLALLRLLRDPDRRVRESTRFLAGWAALVLLPLSLSRGKIDYYLLPVYPALALLVGRYLARTPWCRLDRAWTRAALMAGAAALTLVAARPPHVPAAWLPGPGPRALLLVVLGLAAFSLVVVALRLSPTGLTATLAASAAALSLLIVVFFLPAFAAGQPNRRIVEDVARERLYRPGLALAYCSDPPRARRDVLFHVGLPARERCPLWPLAASGEPYLLFLTPAEHASFQAIPGYRHVASYSALPARILTLGGLLNLPPVGEMVLAATFPTQDPVAERKRKREYRRSLQEERRRLTTGGSGP